MTDKGLAYWPVHCIRDKENNKTEKNYLTIERLFNYNTVS